MKRILSLMAAVLMALTLAGCGYSEPNTGTGNNQHNDGGERLSTSEYEDNVVNLVCGFIDADKQYAIDIENADYNEVNNITNKFLAESRDYLSKLEELNPPTGEKSFHEEVIKFAKYGYLYIDTVHDIWENYDNSLIVDSISKQSQEYVVDMNNQLSILSESEEWFRTAMVAKGYM